MQLDGVEFGSVFVSWNGLMASLADMEDGGWRISLHRGSWREPIRSRLYLRHPETGMLARASFHPDNPPKEGDVLELDFLTPDRAVKKKPWRIEEVTEPEALGEEHIGPLLDTIRQIQERRPRRPPSPATVISLFEERKAG